MATAQPTEFPSLDDVRLPSTPEDKEILKELKLAWDQHSAQWDNKTKHEFVDHILKGYAKVTKTNQSQPSGHRFWKAADMTFAIWIILRVTYDEDKLSKPKELLRYKYKNFDPESWVSPVFQKPAKPRRTNGEKTSSLEENLRSHGRSQDPIFPPSIEAMEICEEESDHDDIHDDGTYKADSDDGDDQDETNDKAITRSRFRAVNVPEAGRDLSRKRRTSNASVNLRTKLQKTDSPETPPSAEAAHLLETSGQSTAPTVDSQARPRPLEWKAKLHELKEYRRGLNQNRPAFNRASSAGDQAFPLSVNPSRQWVRSQERSSRLSAPVVSYEKADDRSASEDPRDRILTRGYSTPNNHVRAKFGLADQRSGESGASTQCLPRSIEYRDNTSTMAPQDSSDSFVFPSSSHGQQKPHTRESLPLRLTHRETFESPEDVSAQQPSGLQQLPLDDPDEPSWFRQFRTQYYSDQKETREGIAYHIKRQVTGIVFQAVQDLIQPLSKSIAQCVDTLAKHNNNAAGDQAKSAIRDLRDMKKILNTIVDTSRVQLETSQRERASLNELLLPTITEHRKDIDDLVHRATSIEERTSDVEEYLELQLSNKGGDSVRNAPQGNENEHHTFGNHENAGGN
ncbi:hypothetical protein F52700_9459 [Fusarium sp. NRRL 52700]|nr:hypothetical protein F52700_9459 [Fusarium sp. NRRL 52700]